MINQSRRTILKGLGYGAALTAGGLASSTAMALTTKSTNIQTTGTSLPCCDITIYQQQSASKEIVSLMNLTDKRVTLNSITPVGLEHVNGSLVVKLNQVGEFSKGAVTLNPGERLSFEIEAISKNNPIDDLQIPNVLAGHLRITSDHPAFNGIIPVTVFDGQA